MLYSHYKIVSGPAHVRALKYLEGYEAAISQANALAKKWGAEPGRFQICGSCIEGLWFYGPTPGWRDSKACRGYKVPSGTKLGKTFKEALEAIRVPSSERLAIDLGFKPFFMDLEDGQRYCANVGVFQHMGVVYLQCCKWCPHDKRFPEIEFIPGSEWHKADEDRAALAKTAL